MLHEETTRYLNHFNAGQPGVAIYLSPYSVYDGETDSSHVTSNSWLAIYNGLKVLLRSRHHPSLSEITTPARRKNMDGWTEFWQADGDHEH
jgi:hypothetical protein